MPSISALILAVLAMGSHAPAPQPEVARSVSGADPESAQVVWRYDTGG